MCDDPCDTYLRVDVSFSFLSKIEPFFISLALYDAAKGLKITEDFHVDLNDFHLREMLDQHKAKTLSANNKSLKIGASELKSEEQWPTMSNQVCCSVHFHCKCDLSTYICVVIYMHVLCYGLWYSVSFL